MCFRDSVNRPTADEAVLAPRPAKDERNPTFQPCEASNARDKKSYSIFNIKARRRAEATAAIESYKQEHPDLRQRVDDLEGCEHRYATPWNTGMYAATDIVPKSKGDPQL